MDKNIFLGIIGILLVVISTVLFEVRPTIETQTDCFDKYNSIINDVSCTKETADMSHPFWWFGLITYGLGLIFVMCGFLRWMYLALAEAF